MCIFNKLEEILRYVTRLIKVRYVYKSFLVKQGKGRYIEKNYTYLLKFFKSKTNNC